MFFTQLGLRIFAVLHRAIPCDLNYHTDQPILVHPAYPLRPPYFALALSPRPLLDAVSSGDEAHIPMSGSIGPRFSFTHYPQAGAANGPGATLVRPVPDPSAPVVNFLGMSPRDGGGGGFAMGTLGPILGEVGTSKARVLVEV